jgi:hypothetical protein
MAAASITFNSLFPLLYTFGGGTSYLNLYPVRGRFVLWIGATLGVPNGGSLYTISLTNDQVQTLGNALRFYLATGTASGTINGIALSNGNPGVTFTIGAISYSITLSDTEVAKLASAALQYIVTKAPPQPPSGGDNGNF